MDIPILNIINLHSMNTFVQVDSVFSCDDFIGDVFSLTFSLSAWHSCFFYRVSLIKRILSINILKKFKNN